MDQRPGAVPALSNLVNARRLPSGFRLVGVDLAATLFQRADELLACDGRAWRPLD